MFLLHLIWIPLGRAWRVEVKERNRCRRPAMGKWLPMPYIDAMAVTSSRDVAKRIRTEAVELILAKGWTEGVT
jgi:hypothetical protein